MLSIVRQRLELNRCEGIAINENLEVAMATAEYVLQTLTDVEQHIEMLITVTNPGEIVRAANHYLATWSKDRIENLQKIDGGWGPFDSQKRPESIHGVGH